MIQINAPASKSYLQRVLAISTLASGKTTVNNISWCNDSLAVKKIVEQLGAKITETENAITINNEKLQINNPYFNVGESGLALRMFSSILSLFNQEKTIYAQGSLLNRPIEEIINALQQSEIKISTQQGKTPLTLKGTLKAGNYIIDGSQSSQILTGLLIALPLLKENSIIDAINLKSKPYIDLTIGIMKLFGVSIENNNYEKFIINGNQKYISTNINIEGDWSGAAYFLVYGAVKNKIEIKNLDYNSKQADKQIIDALKSAGALVTISKNSVIVEKNQLNSFNFDASNCPDLFPPLVCLASQCNGISTIKGTNRLIHKESNRAEVLKTEFNKIGLQISVNDNVMTITPAKLKAGTINSNNDHRIAMVAGLMNLFCKNGTINIENKEAINKSYPNYFNDILNNKL